jgi:transcriptional regulator with XRE-family HTH domain
MTLRDRIRERLAAIGMKQIDLVRSSGVPQSTLASIFQRDTRTTPHLMKLAAALRTTPAYLLGETDDPEAEGAEAVLSQEEQQLVIGLRRLTREDFETVAGLVYRLAEPQAGWVYRAENDEPSRTFHDAQDSYNAVGPSRKWGD